MALAVVTPEGCASLIADGQVPPLSPRQYLAEETMRALASGDPDSDTLALLVVRHRAVAYFLESVKNRPRLAAQAGERLPGEIGLNTEAEIAEEVARLKSMASYLDAMLPY